MAKLLFFDFVCSDNHSTEELVDPNDTSIECPQCGKTAKRIISGTSIDPNLGLSNDFPSMADKWAKKTRARAKNDKLTDNHNLLMY